MQHEVTITTGEIRDAWSTIQTGKNPFGAHGRGWATEGNLSRYRGSEVNSWVGASGAQIQDRLQNGYHVEAKDVNLPGGEAQTAAPFMELDEEQGDLIVSAALAGDDLYRVQWTDLEAKRGLTISACIGMHAAVDAKTIGEYMTWILKLVDAAQRRGITPDVNLWVGISDCFTGTGASDLLKVRIPLVRAGEVMDTVAWRAFMAPGAFRSLGFVAIALAADRVKRKIRIDLGKPTNTRWSVKHEGETLEIECPGDADSFPELELDRMLERAQV